MRGIRRVWQYPVLEKGELFGIFWKEETILTVKSWIDIAREG